MLELREELIEEVFLDSEVTFWTVWSDMSGEADEFIEELVLISVLTYEAVEAVPSLKDD